MKPARQSVALLAALLAASLVLAQAADPVASNLAAAQRPGTWLVDISYDVTADTPTVTVSLEVSVDGGSIWTVPVTATSGHIGTNIAWARARPSSGMPGWIETTHTARKPATGRRRAGNRTTFGRAIRWKTRGEPAGTNRGRSKACCGSSPCSP